MTDRNSPKPSFGVHKTSCFRGTGLVQYYIGTSSIEDTANAVLLCLQFQVCHRIMGIRYSPESTEESQLSGLFSSMSAPNAFTSYAERKPLSRNKVC